MRQIGSHLHSYTYETSIGSGNDRVARTCALGAAVKQNPPHTSTLDAGPSATTIFVTNTI